MLKKSLLIFSLLFTTAAYCQNLQTNLSIDNNLITTFTKLPHEQLYDTANYYLKQNSFDTALVCFSIIINSPTKDINIEKQERIIESYNKSAVIYYYYMSDFRSSYDFLIKALLLCEKTNYILSPHKIYTNIGNVYYYFGKYDMAKWYYDKALDFPQDSTSIVLLLSNLGVAEMETESIDRAYELFNQSMQISKRHDDYFLSGIWNNIGSFYQKTKKYDSAYYYLKLSLGEARKKEQIAIETETLSELSKLFFETKKNDSALYYIDLSNALAEKLNFLRIMAENYLTLSKIEESKGKIRNAFNFYKKYVDLKYSIYSTGIFGDINQLQRLYEISKTNQQIEQLIMEQQIKERTIQYQKTIWIITLFVLLLVSAGLLYIYIQKKKLSKAYEVLFEKNIEIVELQHNSPDKHAEKYRKCVLNDHISEELLEKILTIMEDRTIICNTEFSLEKLAELVQSNRTYVSQVINVALKKNFCSFLNGYRIREAQRLISETDVAKYTIDSIAIRIGFKAQSTFYEAFKEITGVSPTFYLKSIQEQKKL